MRLTFVVLLLSALAAAGTPSTDLFIPAVARAQGAFGTYWTSDVRLFNPGDAPVDVTVAYLPQTAYAAQAGTVVVTLQAGAVDLLANILENTFGIVETSAGALHLTAAQPILAESRTWTPGAAGSYGQRIPGVPLAQGVAAGQSSDLLYIDGTTDFRTNVGMVDVSGAGSEVTLTAYDATGAPAGTPMDVSLGAYEPRQFNGILTAMGVGTGSNYRIRFSVASGKAIPYASQVDNTSGDPIFVDGSVVTASGGGNCGSARLHGFYEQTNNGTWLGFIFAPFSVTVNNYNITYWNPENTNIIYMATSKYTTPLGFGGPLDPPIAAADGQPFAFSLSYTYNDTNGKEIMTSEFDIQGVFTCPNLMSGTMVGVIVAKDPAYSTYAGKYYWSFEAGIQ